MGFRILVSSLVFAFALGAQADPPAVMSPLRAVQESAVAAPRSEGLVVEVVSEKGLPVAGAIVGVLPATWSPEQASAIALLDMTCADAPNERLAALLLRFGERHRCDAGGRAFVPPTALHLAACDGTFAGELVLATPSKDVVRITLLPPTAVLARVLGPQGRPVAGMRVGLAEGRFPWRDEVRTDARGERVLSLPPGRDRSQVSLVALVAGVDVRTALPVGPLPRTPIELRLPPTGLLRVIVYDEHEQPRTDVAHAYLRGDQGHPPVTILPNAKGDLLMHAALGLRFTVKVVVRGITGDLQAECVGPTRAGELIVCDVRATTGAPVLVFRVCGIDGEPVRGAGLRGRLGTGRTGGWQELTVGDDGCVRLAVPTGFAAERLVLMRRPPNQGRRVTQYLGGASVEVPKELRSGDNQLPEVQLVEEPVVASGVVVDDAGKPLAGLLVSVLLAFGDEEPFFGDVEQVRSDAEGRFEARDIRDATTVRLSPAEWTAGYEFAKLEVVRGNREARLVLARQGRVQLRFDGVPDTEHGLLYASLVPARGAVAASQELRIRAGRASVAKAAGRYDLVLSLRRDDFEVARIPDVVVTVGSDTEDPRLLPFPWRDHLELVTITSVDEAGAPVVGAMVWCLFEKPDGSGGGGGGLTDERGRFAALVPKAGAHFRIEPHELMKGPPRRAVDLGVLAADRTVELRPRLQVRVQLQGDHALPGATYVHWQLVPKAGRGDQKTIHVGGATPTPTPDAEGVMSFFCDEPGSYKVDLGYGVPEATGRVQLASLTWGTIEVVESRDVQTFRLAADETTQESLAAIRERLRK